MRRRPTEVAIFHVTACHDGQLVLYRPGRAWRVLMLLHYLSLLHAAILSPAKSSGIGGRFPDSTSLPRLLCLCKQPL